MTVYRTGCGQPGSGEHVGNIPEHLDIPIVGLLHHVNINFSAVDVSVDECRWLLQRTRPSVVTDPPDFVVPRILENKAPTNQAEPQPFKISNIYKKV
jgi:hypothetical protein